MMKPVRSLFIFGVIAGCGAAIPAGSTGTCKFYRNGSYGTCMELVSIAPNSREDAQKNLELMCQSHEQTGQTSVAKIEDKCP